MHAVLSVAGSAGGGHSRVISGLIGAVGHRLINHLVYDFHEGVIALGHNAGLAEGRFFIAESEIGHFQRALALLHQGHAHGVVHHEARDVAILGFQRQIRILGQLKQLGIRQRLHNQLALDGAQLRAHLLACQGFLGGIGIRIAGLNDQQLRALFILVGEIDHLRPFLGDGEGGQTHINHAALHGGDDTVKGHILHFQLHAQGCGDLEKLADLCARFPGQVRPFDVDLSDRAKVDTFVQVLAASAPAPTHFIHLPALPVVNAKFKAFDQTRFDRDLEIQVHSAVRLCRAVLPAMAKARFGRVLFIQTSYTIGCPPKNTAAYVMAKSAIGGLVKSLAVEYARFGVTVNCVAPSMMETNFLKDTPDLIVQAAAEENPMGRNATPADVVPAMAFLLSDEADYITGETLRVDGGFALPGVPEGWAEPHPVDTRFVQAAYEQMLKNEEETDNG